MTIKNKLIAVFILFLFTTIQVFSQDTSKYLLWSSTNKLTANDFAIKSNQLETTSSFGQFSVDYQISGFDFLTKNFNKKVRNNFLKTASWIDTTTNLNQSLIYQQSLFDICEIYARQFRKALRENRKKIISGTKIAEELNSHFMTQFARRRIDYDRDTKFGTNLTKQKEWEITIKDELTLLNKFAYEN